MIVEGLVIAAYIALVVFAVTVFFRMAYDIRAIRQMLENMGLFSGIPCGSCWMPVPEGARVCGHCGRELGQATGS